MIRQDLHLALTRRVAERLGWSHIEQRTEYWEEAGESGMEAVLYGELCPDEMQRIPSYASNVGTALDLVPLEATFVVQHLIGEDHYLVVFHGADRRVPAADRDLAVAICEAYLEWTKPTSEMKADPVCDAEVMLAQHAQGDTDLTDEAARLITALVAELKAQREAGVK